MAEDNAHRTTVVGEYARSHSGQNYHAVCTHPDCDWKGNTYGGNPATRNQAQEEANRHFAEKNPDLFHDRRQSKGNGTQGQPGLTSL